LAREKFGLEDIKIGSSGFRDGYHHIKLMN